MERGELAEGLDVGPGLGAAVGADEVVLQAAGHGAELRGRGGVGDDAVGGGVARGRQDALGTCLAPAVGAGVGLADGGGGGAALFWLLPGHQNCELPGGGRRLFCTLLRREAGRLSVVARGRGRGRRRRATVGRDRGLGRRGRQRAAGR